MLITQNLFIYINVFIALIFVVSVVKSFYDGILYGIVSLLYTALSIFAAWFFSPVLSNLYPIVSMVDEIGYAGFDPIVNTVIYFVIIVVILKILFFVISPITKVVSKIPVIGMINRIGGALFGFVNAVILTMVLSMIFMTPLFLNGAEVVENTLFKNVSDLTKLSISHLNEKVDFSKFEAWEDFDADEARDAFQEWLTYEVK